MTLVTPTAFAEHFFKCIADAYEVIGFLSSKLSAAQREEAAQMRDQPLREAIKVLSDLHDFLHGVCVARSEAIGGLAVAGPEGSFPSNSVKGLEFTVRNLEALADDLEDASINLLLVRLRTLVNEARIEASFGAQVIMTQSDHPTHRE